MNTLVPLWVLQTFLGAGVIWFLIAIIYMIWLRNPR